MYTVGCNNIKTIIAISIIINMDKIFFDDPVSMYGYYNFLPDVLDGLEDDDDVIIIISPEVDHLTNVEEFNDNEIQIMNMPNDVAGNIEIMKSVQADDQ
ncbi:hypothetical protein FQA39_LY07552 [Lamprigera yunnana]|nr:hypothetical protein FQA39_LY07552 [Lamprigera yunnana]